MKRKKYKIAIDVSPLSDGNSLRGVGYYTQNLVEAIQSEIKSNPQYQDFQVDLVTQPDKLRSDNYHLVHYPYFDYFKRSLPSTDTPFIVSLHDMIPIEFSSHFPVGLKGKINWFIQKYRLLKAKYLITISHYSKYAINQLTHYPVDQIFVTYLAADKSFKPITDQKILSKIRTKYHLPKNFVLYVGDLGWNKNIPNLVKACFKLKYPLVIVGSAATKEVPVHPWTEDIHWLQHFQQQLLASKKDSLVLTGFVPDSDLPAIFNLATIYCQPSYAEGFGLPPLQAMQSGCPIVYSQETSLPEVVDFNGEFFNPYLEGDLARALKKLWTDLSLQQKYRKLGLAHAKTFTWRQTAISTLALYRLALIDEK